MFKAFRYIFAILSLPLTVHANIDKAEIRKVEKQVASIYQERIAAEGSRLLFINLWGAEETNAFPRWIPELNTRFIEVQFSTKPQNLSAEGFAFMICHEVGHFFGGQPLIHKHLPLSVEGQSDYFAAKDCIKKYFAKFKTPEIQNKNLEKICRQVYSSKEQVHICKASLAAGKNFIDSQEDGYTAFNKPDEYITKRTIGLFNYPTQQCRLDTIKAGVLCPLNSGSISTECEKSLLAKRPLCWYKPSYGSIQKQIQ